MRRNGPIFQNLWMNGAHSLARRLKIKISISLYAAARPQLIHIRGPALEQNISIRNPSAERLAAPSAVRFALCSVLLRAMVHTYSMFRFPVAPLHN